MEEEAAKGELERPWSAIESFPRDLLRRLGGSSCFGEQSEVPGGESEEGEFDLDLGLSLGGCYGVDPKGKKLVRSSSIASFSLPREQEFPTVSLALVRTSSLPTENEEDRRKRKEMQGLRRLEAKRKRLEKRNSIRLGAAKSDEGMNGGKSVAAPMMIGGRLELPIGSQFTGVLNVVIPPRLPVWAAGNKLPAMQGTVASQGSSSSAVLEVESQMPTQGFNLPISSNNANAKNTYTIGRPIAPVGGEKDPSKKVAEATNDANMEKNMIGEMPCVFTRGDGPNGRSIEGFLYKYKKGEEIRIVCVCHGNFLTPAEFVKHAGGGDVAHPMRHIVVSPFPGAFL